MTREPALLEAAPMQRSLAAVLAAALSSAFIPPCAAQTAPISDLRVVIATAAVTGLDCRSRGFDMEFTRSVGRGFKYMGRGMITEGFDPRPMISGFFAMVVMTPMIILAVPADIIALPFRKQCSFDFHAEGTLARWAGEVTGEHPVAVEGRNALDPGTEGICAPTWFTARSSATTDDAGRFALSVQGHVGRSPDYDMGWTVKDLPSGRMRLSKNFGKFVLSEPEPEFGSPVDTLEPVEIVPVLKR
jgi:hypothetical protein